MNKCLVLVSNVTSTYLLVMLYKTPPDCLHFFPLGLFASKVFNEFDLIHHNPYNVRTKAYNYPSDPTVDSSIGEHEQHSPSFRIFIWIHLAKRQA